MMAANAEWRRTSGRGTACVGERLEDRRLLSAALAVSESLMVFNAVAGQAQSQTLTLTNSGDAPLTVTRLTKGAEPGHAVDGSGTFGVTDSGGFPKTLAAGATTDLVVSYVPTAVGLDFAVLDVGSDDPALPPTEVRLHGIGTAGRGGTNQPSLMRILHAYDFPNYDRVGQTDEAEPLYPEPPAANSGEVPLQRLVKAGDGPVTIDVLASFTADAATPYVLGRYDPADPAHTRQELFHTPRAEAQTVDVHPQGTTRL